MTTTSTPSTPDLAVRAGGAADLTDHLIAGRRVPGAGDRWIDAVDPATEESTARVLAATGPEVAEAVAAARSAAARWRATPAGDRAAALRAAAAAVRADRERLADVHVRRTPPVPAGRR